jgi:hypothetical protein
MSLGQGLERQTSHAAFGPDPRLWRQPTALFHAALREDGVHGSLFLLADRC